MNQTAANGAGFSRGQRERKRPHVTLIGAGPGDPELMTLRAARALGAADVVLVDALVHRGCLAHARAAATAPKAKAA